MTCSADRTEHGVSDEEFAAGIRNGVGVYRAVCGHAVAAQPLICPPGHRCRTCSAQAAAARRRR
jgi:hypothetical protein